MKTPLDEQHLLAKVRDYSAQLNVDPASDDFIPLAQCYLALGLTDAALDAVKRGMVQNPDNVTGRLLFATLLSNIGEHDDAFAAYEQVLHDDPDNEKAMIGLVELDIQLSHCARAAGRLDRIRLVYPHNIAIKALEQQLESLCSDGEADDSVSLPTATMAELFLKQGLKEKAIGIYQRLLQQQPDNELFRTKITDLTCSSVDCDESCADQSVLEGLERWIAAIDRRRKHV